MSISGIVYGLPPDAELVAVARACLARGESLDQAARAVLKRTRSPIAAIKALRVAEPGLSLADAKPIVDRCLRPRVRRANERLREDIVRQVMAAIESADGLDVE